MYYYHYLTLLSALPHQAAVEVLVHLAEGVRGNLPLSWDDDANISDGQRRVGLALRGPTVGDVDSLGGRAADIGRPTRGRGLDNVTTRLQLFLPLVENPGTQGVQSFLLA